MNAHANLVVVALGGHAISPQHAEDDIPHQFDTSRRTAARLADLMAGRRIVITHGNGPQVGNVLRRVELAAHELYTLPLDICVADTQAGMGYMIAQCLHNELASRGSTNAIAALVTTVEVDPADPAFTNPSKPIGRTYAAEQAERMQSQYGWPMQASRGGGFRRVVPSPAPRAVVELEAIRALIAAGCTPIVAGGGGIPVVRGPDGAVRGVEAVVDKDRTAAVLAAALGAEALMIATDVPGVMADFGKPNQRRIERIALAEAGMRLRAGEFPAGSMGPKVEAAVDFLTRTANPHAWAAICSIDELTAAAAGAAGTRFERALV
jgi:carbamate kinase